MNTDFVLSATEGWSDADGDTLQYQFAYTTDTGADAKYFSYTPQAESSFTSQLPTGNLTVRVRCVDVYGGYSEAFQQVRIRIVFRPKNFSPVGIERALPERCEYIEIPI